MCYFCHNNKKIMPNWFPWIFVGGILFIVLSYIGAKYQDKVYRKVQYLQDFISGAILIGFVGVMMPDVFPKMDIPVELPISINGGSSNTDFDLQVGPPRLVGR